MIYDGCQEEDSEDVGLDYIIVQMWNVDAEERGDQKTRSDESIGVEKNVSAILKE